MITGCSCYEDSIHPSLQQIIPWLNLHTKQVHHWQLNIARRARPHIVIELSPAATQLLIALSLSMSLHVSQRFNPRQLSSGRFRAIYVQFMEVHLRDLDHELESVSQR